MKTLLKELCAVIGLCAIVFSGVFTIIAGPSYFRKGVRFEKIVCDGVRYTIAYDRLGRFCGFVPGAEELVEPVPLLSIHDLEPSTNATRPSLL